MVETLNNLKNNKVKRAAPQANLNESERISKFVTGLDKKYHGTKLIRQCELF